jgi:preprotein translocase subunit YajC
MFARLFILNLQGFHMTNIFGFLPLLMGVGQGQAGAGGQQGGSSQLITMLVTFGLIIVVFYFLVIRPQNKKKKQAKEMLENIKKGDRVVTIGGIHGTVDSTRDDGVVLKVDENVKVKFSKSAVAQVISRGEDSGDTKE